MSDPPHGEYEVKNKYGDLVQRGETITIEVPGGVDSLLNPPATLRQGDSFVSTTVIQFEE